MANGYDTYEVEEPRHSKHRSHREPRYVETKETYVRGNAPLAATLSPNAAYSSRQTELIRQPLRQDSDLSIEEVRRDFPPPSAGSYAAQRTLVREDQYGPVSRARSSDDRYGDYHGDRRRSYNEHDRDRRGRRDYVEEVIEERPRSLTRNQKIIAAVGGAALAMGGKELWDRRQAASNIDGERMPRNNMATAAVGAAGAFAGYEGAELYAKKVMNKDKPKKKVHAIEAKNSKAEYISSDEEAHHRKKSSKRRGSSSSDGKKSGKDRDKDRDNKDKDKEPDKRAKIQQSAKAALLAGAYEAFRVRNEPGTWNGEKGKRIITAAIGAGGIDAAADRKPGESKRHILEAVVGGLAGNRLINGSRKEVVADEVTGRSTSRARSRSRAPSTKGDDTAPGGGLGALAAAGIAGLAGSKLLSRSRSRARKDSDDDSDDSRSRGAGGSKKRSKSVTDFARKGLAALGLGEAASKIGGHDERDDDSRSYRSRRDQSRDPYDDRYADSRSSVAGRSRNGGGRRRYDDYPDSDDSSLGSSSGDERRIKKMKARRH